VILYRDINDVRWHSDHDVRLICIFRRRIAILSRGCSN
jgi:hypothetical protein